MDFDREGTVPRTWTVEVPLPANALTVRSLHDMPTRSNGCYFLSSLSFSFFRSRDAIFIVADETGLPKPEMVFYGVSCIVFA